MEFIGCYAELLMAIIRMVSVLTVLDKVLLMSKAKLH